MKINKTETLILSSFLLSILIVSGFYFLIYRNNFKADTGDNFSQENAVNWQPHGAGMGGKVSRVVVDQTSPNIVYLGTDNAGIFKSTESGENWAVKNNGIDNYSISGIVIDKDNHNVLYTISDKKIYKSTDAGETWVAKMSGLNSYYGFNSNAGTMQLVQSQSNGNVLYALSCSGSDKPENYSCKVYKSSDRSETWNKVDGGFTEGTKIVHPLDPDPNSTGYSGIEDKTLFRSIAIDPDHSNILYIGGERGLFKSEDSGNTWSRFENLNISIDALLPRLCNSTDGVDLDLFENDSTKCTQTYKEGPLNRTFNNYSVAYDIRSIAINPYNSNQIFALNTWGHIYRTNDGGLSWNEIYHRDIGYEWHERDWESFDSPQFDSTDRRSSGILYMTMKLDMNPDPNNKLICGTDPDPSKIDLSKCDFYLYMNHTGGWIGSKEMWRIKSSDMKTTAYNLDYAKYPKTACVAGNSPESDWELLYLGNKTGGNLKREEGYAFGLGSQWDGFTQTNDFDLSGIYPNRNIYATALAGVAKATPENSVFTPSSNTGECGRIYNFNYKWQWKWQGLENYSPNKIVYDPIDPKYVYVASWDIGFFRSTDGGKTFERSLDGAKTIIKLLNGGSCKTDIGPNDNIESKDFYDQCFWGHGWSLDAVKSIDDPTKTILYLSGSRFGFAGGKIFQSLDRGENWIDVSGSLPFHVLGSDNGSRYMGDINVNPENPDDVIISQSQLFASMTKCKADFTAASGNSASYLTNPSDPTQIASLSWETNCSGNLSAEKKSLLNNNSMVNISSPIYLGHKNTDGVWEWQGIKEGVGAGLPDTSWGTVAAAYDNNGKRTLYYGLTGYTNAVKENTRIYGIYKSEDDGQSWSMILKSYEGILSHHHRIQNIQVDPFDNQTILAVSEAESQTEVRVVKSTDGGANWKSVGDFQANLGFITFDPYNSGRVALSLDSNGYNIATEALLFSNDKGDTWTQQTKSLPNLKTLTVGFHPTNPTKVVVGSPGGGISWSYDVESIPYTITSPLYTYKSVFHLTGTRIDREVILLINNNQNIEVKYDGLNWSADIPLNLGKKEVSIQNQVNLIKWSEPENISVNRKILGDSYPLEGDGIVNEREYSILMSDWGTNRTSSDFDGNGKVDEIDYSILMAHWTK